MAKFKEQIGTILKAGPQVQAKPLAGSAKPFKTYGEARKFFACMGSNGVPRPGQVAAGGRRIVFEGDFAITGQQDVFAVWQTA